MRRSSVTWPRAYCAAVPETAPRFVEQLQSRQIPIDDIHLDPNNPRLTSAGVAPVPDDRVGEPQVQARTLDRLDSGPHDLARMRDSIIRSGLLPIDRIVVRPLDADDAKYVIVEGNRRIGAVKQVLELQANAEVTLDESILETLREPTVLVLEQHDEATARTDQWVIQGIRHISGARPWGAWQVARTIQAMRDDLGYDEKQIADTLTVPVARVKRALNVLSVLNQMGEDEDFGDQAAPDLFGYFDEAVRSVKVRNWLGWNAQTREFEHDEHRAQFYSWITPDDTFGGDSEQRRIPAPDGVRKLNKILENEQAISVLDTPGTDVDAAYAALGLVGEPEWRPPVRRAIDALEAIPIGTLEHMEDDDKTLLTDLLDLAQRRLDQAATLGEGNSAQAS